MARQFEPARTTIVYRDNPLMQVRGLNLVDCSVLVNKYLDELKSLFSMIQDANRDDMIATMMRPDFIAQVATQAPGILGTIVNLASDDAFTIEDCTKLPIGVQVDCINAIVKLTVEDAGGPKELAALVRRLVTAQLRAAATG